MKRLFFFILFVLSLFCVSKAMEVRYPLDVLVHESDIIVVGTLQDVSEFTKDGVDYGEGKILVEEVLWGNARVGEKLLLKWRNASAIMCPRDEHAHNKDKKLVWLLTSSDTGVVYASNSGRVVKLDKLSEVKNLMIETHIILDGEKLFVPKDAPLNVTLKIRNYSNSEKNLPGFKIENGLLYLNPKLKLNLSTYPPNFENLINYKLIPLKLSDRVIISNDVPPITMSPRSDVSFDLDLRPYFGSELKSDKNYSASFNFKDFSQSNEVEFIITDERVENNNSQSKQTKLALKKPESIFYEKDMLIPILLASLTFFIALLIFRCVYVKKR